MSLLYPKATFKSDCGVWLTSALFVETATHSKDYILFTLKGEDYKGFESFPKLFLSLTEKDPTEYDMAMTIFGSWEHWVDIANSAKLKPVMKKLREEVSVRQKSAAMKFMIKEVETNSRNSFASAKLLLSKPWEDTPLTPAKRKAAKKQNQEEDRRVLSDLQADARRVGLIN